jgi:hypothetical protein
MNGFILFDDSSEDSPFGVARLMQEILGEERYRLVARDPNYLLQKTADAAVQL